MGWINLPYTGQAGQFPAVDTFAGLPDAAAYSGQTYIVRTSTGILPRRSKGLYYSDGASWTYLGDRLLTNGGLSVSYDDSSATLTTETAAGIIVSFACASNAGVGALVQLSQATEDFIEVVSSNVYAGLVIGTIETKPTATSATVRLLGARSGYSGLETGKVVYVATNGAPTTTVPLTGDLQKLGVALSTTKILFNPSTDKVIR